MIYIEIIPIVKHIQKYIGDLYITGSYRRKEPIIDNLDFITKIDLKGIVSRFNFRYNISDINQNDEYLQFILKIDNSEINITVWKANDKYEYQFLKYMKDMNKSKNIEYKNIASTNGLILTDKGLKKGDKFIHIGKNTNLIKAITIWDYNFPIIDNENNIRL